MRTFLGMPIYRELSDEEFVEKARKRLRRSRWTIWIGLGVFICLCVFIPKGIMLLFSLTDQIPIDRIGIYAGLVLGFVFGWMISYLTLAAAECILREFKILDVNKADRLLVKYYDLLKQNEMLESSDEPD